MTNRHRRITLQKQLRHRPSDNLAATNDTRIRSANLDAAIIKQLDNARGRARYEDRSSHRQLARVYRMKAVDVLRRIHRLDDRSLVNVSRKRKLRKYPVNIITCVQ